MYAITFHSPSHCKIGASSAEAPILVPARAARFVCVVFLFVCREHRRNTKKGCVLHTFAAMDIKVGKSGNPRCPLR